MYVHIYIYVCTCPISYIKRYSLHIVNFWAKAVVFTYIYIYMHLYIHIYTEIDMETASNVSPARSSGSSQEACVTSVSNNRMHCRPLTCNCCKKINVMSGVRPQYHAQDPFSGHKNETHKVIYAYTCK